MAISPQHLLLLSSRYHLQAINRTFLEMIRKRIGGNEFGNKSERNVGNQRIGKIEGWNSQYIKCSPSSNPLMNQSSLHLLNLLSETHANSRVLVRLVFWTSLSTARTSKSRLSNTSVVSFQGRTT